MSNPILDQKYVSLTTFRTTGVGVPSPIWIVRIDERTGGFYTDLDSGKMKRIRNNPKVTMQACDVRGRVAAGADIIHASAAIVDGAASEAVSAALAAKYSLMIKLFAVGKFFKKLLRRPEAPTCTVHLTID